MTLILKYWNEKANIIGMIDGTRKCSLLIIL